MAKGKKKAAPKVGKKPRKAAWRKLDIEDVEETLEDNRLVNKLKKKGTSKNESDNIHELFTIDTAGSGQGLSARTRREIARAKLFPPKGPNIGLSASEEGKIARAGRQLEASKAPKAQDSAVFDIWSEKTEAELLRERRVDSTVRLLPQPRPVSTPKGVGEKISSAPAVVPAHEGQSVNPLATSYEDVACLAAAKQLEQEQEEEHRQRRSKPMTHELVDFFGEEAVKEMDEETKVLKYRELKCKVATGEGDALEEGGAGKAVKWKQKPQAQRNRERLRKKVEEKQRQVMAQRKLEKSVGSLGAIVKELKEQEKFYKERSEYRKALRGKRKEREETEGGIGKCRRIGRGHFQEDSVMVPASDAAEKGMRAMSVKGCAVKERLASMIRRGMSTPLPESNGSELFRRKKGVAQQKRKRKLVSPLLRENLMLT